MLGVAALAVAVSAAFALVPSAHASDEEHQERMTFGEIAEWVLEHALFSVRARPARAAPPRLGSHV